MSSLVEGSSVVPPTWAERDTLLSRLFHVFLKSIVSICSPLNLSFCPEAAFSEGLRRRRS